MADRITNLIRFVEIGVGFYNLKTPFYCKEVLGGLIDIGTHMSLLKLESGRFIVIDTCPLDPSSKKELDLLTVNGTLIDGVVATHPFHTTYFEPFHALYPNLKYYGTPRHIRNIKTIDWAGDVSKEVVRVLWEPEISMRIPDGAEFNNPAENNRFSSVFVFHKKSRTLHNDNTLMYYDPEHLNCCLRLCGVNSRRIFFHPNLTTGGLHRFPEAVRFFKDWMRRLIDDWDFVNICTAHNGVLMHDGKKMLKLSLKRYEQKFLELSRIKSSRFQQSGRRSFSVTSSKGDKRSSLPAVTVEPFGATFRAPKNPATVYLSPT